MEYTFRTIEYKLVKEKPVELKRRGKITLTVTDYRLMEMKKEDGNVYQDRCLLEVGDKQYIIAEKYDVVLKRIAPVVIKGFVK